MAKYFWVKIFSSVGKTAEKLSINGIIIYHKWDLHFVDYSYLVINKKVPVLKSWNVHHTPKTHFYKSIDIFKLKFQLNFSIFGLNIELKKLYIFEHFYPITFLILINKTEKCNAALLYSSLTILKKSNKLYTFNRLVFKNVKYTVKFT